MLKIYKEAEPKEKIYRLELKEDGESIAVHVVDENGKHLMGGNLLQFNKETGRVRFSPSISGIFGLDLNEVGQLKRGG